MTPDKVEEILNSLELCECEHISGELQSERIRKALTQYHQDLMSEVVEFNEAQLKFWHADALNSEYSSGRMWQAKELQQFIKSLSK